MKTQVKRRQITEESVESKPRNTVPEPTTVSSEVKNLWKSMLKRTQEDIVGGSLKSASEQLLGSSRPKQEEYLIERTVKDATADQAPVRPGKYHLSFFEFVLSVIRDATRKLEDSVSYGAVFTSKKQQSKYWSKYKKHGTTFGLSGERTTAT